MAGIARRLKTSAAIRAVYTPPELRGRDQLDRGCPVPGNKAMSYRVCNDLLRPLRYTGLMLPLYEKLCYRAVETTKQRRRTPVIFKNRFTT
jgi:hypothetical protein